MDKFQLADLKFLWIYVRKNYEVNWGVIKYI